MAHFDNSEDSTPIAKRVFKRDLYVCESKVKAIEIVGIGILASQELYSPMKKQLMPSFTQKYWSHNSMCRAHVSSAGYMAVNKMKSQPLCAYLLSGGGNRNGGMKVGQTINKSIK